MGIFDPIIPINKPGTTPVQQVKQEEYLNPSMDKSFEPTDINVTNYDTRLQSELQDAVNSFRRGIDQTQISNYQGKLDAHQEIIDNNVDKYNKLTELYKQGKIDKITLGTEIQKIEQENNKAFTEISKYQSDIEDNKLEMQDEYVSKMYQMKEAMVQAKGGDAGLWESMKYTMPSTAGSSASLMGQQIAATWGTGLIKKIITSAGAGAIGGPVGEFIAVGGTILSTAALIGNSRYQETMAEIGGQLEQNQQKLLENWQEKNPGLEPDEEVLRQIRMAARKGKDEMFKEQMMLGFWDGAQALLAPGSKVLGAFKTGRKLEKSLGAITDYNKYTRAATTASKFYLGQKAEGFEEGFQYATSKRQEDAALGLGLYENKDFMTNLLTDSYDTVSSMDFGPFKGDGRYADDKEFQFSVKSGELLSMLPGSIATAKSMYDDISTYRKTNKELQQSGIANPEDKFFKLKDQIYVKHFDKNTVSYLLEGVRNLGTQKNEKGIPYLNETEVQAETKNIQEAFDKYLEVSKHIEDILPEGRFNIKYSPEQTIKIAALKSELFHSSMNLTRYAHKFPTIETVSNINNLIKHNENLVKEIQSTLDSDYTLRNVYHLNDRLSLAKNKLTELYDLKKQFLEGSNLEEKDIPEINSIEESNKNKEYIINDLNLSEEKKNYEELLKVKDNETLDIWFDNFIKSNKTKKKEVNKQESKIKLAQETDVNLFAQDVFNKVKDPAAEENIEFYNANREAVDKQLAKLKAEKDKKAVKDIFGDPIEEEEEQEDFDNVDYNKVAKVKSDEKEGKKAETVNKTELGWDGDIFIIVGEKHGIVDFDGEVYTLKNIKTNKEIYVKAKDLSRFKRIAQYPSQERLFRFTENSDNIDSYELAAITKKNNPELYNELLDLQEDELNKDGLNARQTDEEDSIYFVLVDKNHNPILVDGVKLFSYMTRPERYSKGEVKVTEEDVEKLKENRELILNSNDILFFNVIDKSDGIPGFESKDNNQRASKPVVGTIYDNINEVELEMVTLNASTTPENTYGFLSKLPGTIASLGRLYAIFKNQAVDLIPRTLNDKEIDKLADLLFDKLNDKPDISKEIEKLIFFGYGRKEENPTRVAVSKGILYLGNDITMNKTEFDKEVVKNFLKKSGKKVTVNKAYLESNKKFKDIFGVEHKSYNSYLLTGEDRLYGTDLKDKGEGQLLNQYLIYNPTPNKNMNKLTSNLPEVNTENKEDSTDVLNTPGQVNPDISTTDGKYTKAARIKRGNNGKLDRLASISEDKRKLNINETNWFKNKFPDIPIEIIKGLIEAKSLGQFLQSGKVLLSDKATYGTLYHEAFHVVTQLYLTKKEIDNLYAEALKNNPGKTRLELEEILAEDFINYKETGQVLKGAPTRNTLFRRLVNFVKDFLKLSAKDIQDVYRRIDKGYYTNKKRINNQEFSTLNKLADKTEQETKEILDGFTAMFFKVLKADDKTTLDAYKYKDAALNEIYDQFVELEEENPENETFAYILDNFETIANTWVKKMNSLGAGLKEYNVIVDNKTIEEEDEGTETSIVSEEEKSRQDNGYTEANLTSVKSKMFNSTKFLIRGLVEVDKDGSEKLSSIGLPIPVNFDKTYSYLLKNLVGLGNDYEVYYNKLTELAETRPELNQLKEVLKAPGSTTNLHDILQQTQFVQDFNKNKVVSYITLIEEQGKKIYLIDATKQAVSDRIKDKWGANLKSLVKQNNEGKLIIDLESLKGSNNVQYLAKLGLEFSPETIKNIEGSKDFNDAVQAIRNYLIKNNGNLTTLFEDRDIKNRINTLAFLESEFTPDTIELSYMNSENKTVYSIAYNNYLSALKNKINNSEDLADLYRKVPHLQSVTSENSYWISKLFDSNGKRIKTVNIELNLQDGLKNKDTETGTSTSGLSIGDKLVQEINATLLNGLTSFIRASDKATEHTISLSGIDKLPIDLDEFKDGFDIEELKEIFQGYFKSEFKRIALFKINKLGSDIDQYTKSGDKWTVFSFINSELKDKLKEEINAIKSEDLDTEQLNDKLNTVAESYYTQIDAEVIKFFNEYLIKQKAQLEKNKITLDSGISSELKGDKISKLELELNNAQLNGLETLNISNKLDAEKSKRLDQLLRATIATDLINSIEQTKIFTGDMAFYKDLFKRMSAGTGGKEFCRNDKFLNNFLNKNNKRLDKKLADGNINVVVFNDVNLQSNYLDTYKKALESSGLSSNQADQLLGLENDPKDNKGYYNMDEGDAQGWITMDEYREFMFRLGDWDNLKESTWEKLQKNESITSEEMVYFISKKAQYFGPQEYNNQLFAPAFHKYSLMPLIPSLVKGTNMEVLLETMTNQQIGYSLFKTGSKVGTLLNDKGKATKFYTNTTDGEINTKDWIKQTISYEYLGLQQKSSKPHDTVIFGTQFRKLVLSNLYTAGVVNETFPEAEKLLEEYNKIITDLINKEKDKLVKELGLNPALSYVSEDATKLVELLKSEAENRALPANLIDSLQVTQDTKTLRYKFDSMVNKAKIDSMLMSIINSRLIRQKINGDALIQGASSGFETKGTRVKSSNTLKFYTQEGPNGETTHAEVMIAMNDNYRPLLKKYNGDLDALNKAIAEGKVDKRLLQMVGYRIPTQGLNSMDILQVKKFLPESSATLIILPTEIVAKSGGDYDIDKMNVFRPSMDKNGNYINTPENRLIEISTEILKHSSNFNALIIPNSTKILTDLVAEIRHIEHVNDKPGYKGTIEDYQKATKDQLSNIQYIEQLMLSTKTKQFQKFMLAKDMIGVAAVQNTAHIIAQLAGLTLNKTYTVKTKDGKTIQKNRHIGFRHHEGPNNTMDLGQTFDVNGKNKISEVISQIINATVDAAKDPFLFDLNMNLDTLGTYAYLIRIGVPFDTVVYFMKQPIISKYLESLSIYKSEFLGLTSQQAKGKALTEAKNQFILDDTEYGNEYLETKVYENEELKSYLSKDKQVGDDFKANQLHILNKFLEYQDQASMLSDSIKANNHDTAGLGKSLYTSFMKIILKNKVREDNFVNNLENLVNTPIAGFNQVDFSIDAFSQFYDTYSNKTIKFNIDKILNNFKLFKEEDILKTRNLIENDFISYVVQNYGYDDITNYAKELFNDSSVAKELLKVKNNPETAYEIALSNNMLVKELFPLINKAGDNKDNIKIYSRKYDTFTADQLTESFKELEELGQQENQRLFEESGNTEDLNKPTLAKQIMDVGIIQSGLNNSPITYLGIIPFEYYNELVKESFNNFNKKNGAQEMYKFEQLFQRENPGGKPKKGWIYGKNYDINSKQDYQIPAIINEPVVTQTNEQTDNFKNSFEYNNLKIETDFQLSEDQDSALKQLIDFVKDRNKSVVTLEGAAGTGKTSIISYLQKYLGRTNSFAYLAPTHAATVQLAFNTAKIGNKDFPATIASAITIDPKTGRNKFTVKIQKRLGLNPVIVVDESSMIDNSDIDKLMEAIEDIGGKLILMGDEKQIPKVTIVDSLTKQLSGAFTRFEKIKLSKVHRQTNNKLLNILNKMREQISFKLFKTTNSDAVKFVNKREYNELLVEDLLTDPENTMVISYTNDGVKGINTQARKVLGREGETQVGDIVVGYLGYASKQVEKSDIANSINYTITKIEADGPTKFITAKSDKLNELVKLGIKGVTNTATTTYYQMDNNDSLQFDDLTQEDFEMNNDLVSNYFRDINKANIDYANKQITYFSYQTIIASISESLRKVSIGQDYIYNPQTDRMEIFDQKKHSKIRQNGQGSLKMNKDIDYGHAVTIHKSQGSTINNVYFDTSSLNPERDTKILDENGNQITTEKMALAYVAMSRSKNKLVVYEHNLDFEQLKDIPETPTEEIIENISQSEENSVSLQEDWNTFKDEILKKDPEMSFEIWSSLSEEIRQRIKDCL